MASAEADCRADARAGWLAASFGAIDNLLGRGY
jgi:hypothetical protein